jgi:lysyl endopeptidase
MEIECGGLKLHSPSAYSINLIYDEFYLPPGATFFIYNQDKTEVIGAFTDFNNKEHGKFSTSPIVRGCNHS